MLQVFGVPDPSGHDDDVVAVEQAILDEEALEFAQQEARLFGDGVPHIGQGLLDRVRQRAKAKPEHTFVSEFVDDARTS
jgi:hypothetical protein